MHAAEVEVSNEQSNGELEILFLLAVADGATCESARKRADGQICAFNVAGCGHSHIRVSESGLAFDTQDRHGIESDWPVWKCFTKDFGFGGVVNRVAEYFADSSAVAAISVVSVCCELESAGHARL